MLNLTSKEKAKYLKDITSLDVFDAQLQLEHELIAGYEKQVLELDVNNPALNLQYAKLQGCVEALKTLRATRKLLINNNNNNSAESAVKGIN